MEDRLISLASFHGNALIDEALAAVARGEEVTLFSDGFTVRSKLYDHGAIIGLALKPPGSDRFTHGAPILNRSPDAVRATLTTLVGRATHG